MPSPFTSGQRITAANINAANGIQLIQKTTLSGAVASVAFSNISQLYTHLMFEYSVLSTGGTALGYDNIALRLNGISTATYNWNSIYATQGGAVATASATAATSANCGSSWNAHFASQGRGVGTIHLPNYTSTSALKSFTSQGNATDGGAAGVMRSWAGCASAVSAAITSVTFILDVGNFDNGTEISLYGIS